MNRNLVVRNWQRGRRIDLPLLRLIVRELLERELPLDQFDLGVFLVGRKAITEANEAYLQHRGVTDVLAFDYGETRDRRRLNGEILICIEEAIVQARRYRTLWQNEVVRYIVHGVLHLYGYDDRTTAKRRRMKKVEDHLVRRLASRFELRRLEPTR